MASLRKLQRESAYRLRRLNAIAGDLAKDQGMENHFVPLFTTRDAQVEHEKITGEQRTATLQKLLHCE